MFTVSIQDSVFELFPKFSCGLVLVSIPRGNHCETGSDQLEEEMLSAAVNRAELRDSEALWREAYRQAGSDPAVFVPPHLALVSKLPSSIPLQLPSMLPGAIAAVQMIKHLTPVVVDNSPMIADHISLGFARGGEYFIPDDGPDRDLSDDPARTNVEYILPGELVWRAGDTNEVVCRRWNYRCRDRLKISDTTLLFRVDALGEKSEGTVIRVCEDVVGLVARCYGSTRCVTSALTRQSRTHHF